MTKTFIPKENVIGKRKNNKKKLKGNMKLSCNTPCKLLCHIKCIKVIEI